jgi:sn-1 stearoyl-lipid 9-desaturase
MAFLDRVLVKPRYGYQRDGQLYVPTSRELWSEFFAGLNIFRTRKHWLSLLCWSATLVLFVPLALFFAHHFQWKLVFAGFVYSMVVLGTHGTVWLHRYSTHGAYRFRSPLFRALCRNLVIKIVPEETYVISHHVHHRFAEQPGDPYNARAGFLYCFLADVTHQPIAKDLNEADYERLCTMMRHTGVRLNSYANYRQWGSLCHPATTLAHYALNWTSWYAVFYLVGGHALALALFGSAAIWAVGVRTFNYGGHGGGKDLRSTGKDFNEEDHAVNQLWPGYVAGEWHSNHHLYPGSARSGFLWYQLDLAWLFIRGMARVGAVSSYRDYKAEFLRDHYHPYRARSLRNAAQPAE